MAVRSYGTARAIDQIKPELLALLDGLPLAKQVEVLDFARFLAQQSKAPSLQTASASTLVRLTGVVAVGGDAVVDSEALYDGDTTDR